ncbi:MAG: hypothetical protein ACUVWB_14515 [Anaerolineae bacterium]
MRVYAAGCERTRRRHPSNAGEFRGGQELDMWQGATQVIISERAAILVTREPLEQDLEEWEHCIAGDKAQPPLTGVLVCPRGCGTRIYWALAADLASYKEDLLVFLYQQLYWTKCPEHREIQPQVHPRQFQTAPAASPAPAGPGTRDTSPRCYRNRYE